MYVSGNLAFHHDHAHCVDRGYGVLLSTGDAALLLFGSLEGKEGIIDIWMNVFPDECFAKEKK